MYTIHGNGNMSMVIRTSLSNKMVRLTNTFAITKLQGCVYGTLLRKMQSFRDPQTLDLKISPNPKMRIRLLNEEIVTWYYRRISKHTWCMIFKYLRMKSITSYWIKSISHPYWKNMERTSSHHVIASWTFQQKIIHYNVKYITSNYVNQHNRWTPSKHQTNINIHRSTYL